MQIDEKNKAMYGGNTGNWKNRFMEANLLSPPQAVSISQFLPRLG